MIELNKINKYYANEEESLHVLKDIHLSIKKGEMIAIMGPSGSGKSTLINLLGFIDRKFEGEYLFEGRSLVNTSDDILSKIRNQTVGFIFQNFSLIESNTVYENVELPLLYNGVSPFKTKEKVFSVLDRVGLKGKEYKYPKQLSGGQQQRVAIARALINHPKFIIADEPTGALDTHTSEEIMQLFTTLNKEDDVTLIMVTHNPEVVPYCHRLITIRDGAIIEDKELLQ
ncbi:ABC transporter ATP-binding protein [Enterococcus faecalis]|jgi:putative ABC transport system ATP-binding protein|uniref:ABC transporter ATP-binding protein n=1 Tax=Enterococcus TaxID=1350 RepID=UPI00080C8B52|nr:ABC transporter ATP-binding protein [Enterococcus faecalis]ANU71948.1 peptide ABC transporter ATP-binding protein [Enterococcus faecalis]ARV05050.1 peptide ABC transporter ATP-binding protein [Enterococcus faecalis]ASU26648.1 ABC transporter ATP-binding protein [Enterococcus faecalis]EGO8197519.1 ABC transporter ATP-binding protein [Enterococcus faecalis]MBG9437157.1 ABC transporter ATP-binding protein [Enterococcus faecalis]